MNKIAFMFLTVGDLNQPELIRDFLADGGDRCSAYAHSKEKRVLNDIQISEKIDTEWGDISLVKATNLMLAEAYKDPDNKYFLLLSESCVPLYKFDHIYDTITNLGKSWIKRVFTKRDVYLNMKFRKLVEPRKLNINKNKELKLCNQWMVLTREHAEMCIKHDYTDTVFKNAHIPDEAYYLNVLNYHDKDFNENRVNRRITAAKMQNKHPRTYNKPTKFQLDMLRDFEGGECLFGRKVGKDIKLLYNQINKNEKSDTSREKSPYKTRRGSRDVLKYGDIYSRVSTKKNM